MSFFSKFSAFTFGFLAFVFTLVTFPAVFAVNSVKAFVSKKHATTFGGSAEGGV